VLGEAGMLAPAMLSHINQLLDACTPKKLKKLFRCLALEANGAE